MKLMGIGDEAGSGLASQIQATKGLGWQWIEMRTVEVPGQMKGNLHDVPQAAFDAAVQELEAAGL